MNPKYQEGNLVARQDNTRVAKSPTFKPIKQRVTSKPQPQFIQDNRSSWQKEVSDQIKSDRAKSEALYKNQHVWNWSNYGSNIRVTPSNASQVYNFNRDAALSTFAIGTGLANPIAAATSLVGSLAGAGVGKQIAGDKGALIGGLIGGLANPRIVKSAGKWMGKRIAGNQNLGIVAPQFQDRSNITERFIKFTGGRRNEAPVDITKLRGAEKLQAQKLQEAGVDMSKVTPFHLESALGQRRMQLMKTAPEGRFNIIEPNRIFPNTQYVNDYLKLNKQPNQQVGITKLIIDDSNHISIGGTNNIATSPGIHKVEERGLNSAIQLSNQSGLNGVITGADLKSAPKTYSVWKHFKDKESFGSYGEHANDGIIESGINKGKIKVTPDIYKETIISDIGQMVGNATKRLFLPNAPVYRLTKQSGLPTKTKSIIFNPSIIDKTGKMNIDWNNPDIYKILAPFAITTSLNTK